jgi:RND family efflux transporter MFP subunit
MIITFIIVILAAVTAYRFLPGSIHKVTVTTVSSLQPSQASTLLNASGYVVAQRQADVASKGTGRLVELKVREGDPVKKGQVLARLEDADVSAALSRAQANHNVAQFEHERSKAELNEATLSYERGKSLLAPGLISQAEFETVEARYRRAQAGVASTESGVRAAEATVRSAEIDVGNTYIRAPFAGTVLAKNAEVGEVVAPFGSSTLAKTAVVTMADMDSLEVEADISESNIEKIRVGQRCEIILDAYPQAKYEGIVETIVPTADRAKATVLTKIRFLNRDHRVLPEMSAKVAFLSEKIQEDPARTLIAVPAAAMVQKGQGKIVFLIQGDRVMEVPIEVGNQVGNLVEVKSGLKSGDRVVLNPPDSLNSGDKIRIQ